MAKARSKELPHFSKLLNIISEHQKNHGSGSKTNKWRNDVNVLNSLMGILATDTYSELEKWWSNKMQYNSSEATNFKNISGNSNKKFLPSVVWKYYSGSVSASKDLSYQDHIEKLNVKIGVSDEWPHFLTKSFCKDIFDYFYKYSQVSSIGDMNLNSLESEIRSGNYGKFLATVLFFVAADMPEANDRQIDSTPIMESAKEFFLDIHKDLEEGKYYDYYHRKILITTDIGGRVIKNNNTLSFKSPILDRDEPGADFVKFNFAFETLEEYNSCEVVDIKINGEDFLDRHDPLPKNPEEVPDDRSCYKKRFIYSDIPAADSYEVTRTTEVLLSFPVSESVYRLPYSTNDFKFEIGMDRRSEESNMYFDIVCAFFTPFGMNKRLSFIQSSSKHFLVHIEEFVPKGTGIKVVIKPLLKNLELDIKSPTQKNVYLKAKTVNITGIFDEVLDKEYRDE